ncbi:hypothetical protein EYF80_013922 [Liparis tanakae]|uniref:Uncharacterized protein n=1 Tax=Liparis tanakae TaxID=230148 RepID=A0A4Z2IE18_9TELE|nr:hypothetical protein EYF80_013922 [Liparis tanakae]
MNRITAPSPEPTSFIRNAEHRHKLKLMASLHLRGVEHLWRSRRDEEEEEAAGRGEEVSQSPASVQHSSSVAYFPAALELAGQAEYVRGQVAGRSISRKGGAKEGKRGEQNGGEADSSSFLSPSAATCPSLSLSCCMLCPTCTMALHSKHEPITNLRPSSTRRVRVLRGAYRNTGSLATVTAHSLPCLCCSFLQKKHTNASQLYWRAQGELGGWGLAMDKLELEGVEGPDPSCWAHWVCRSW